MAHPPVDPHSGALLLLIVSGWLSVKAAVAFVRLYDHLNTLPPHPTSERRNVSRTPLRIAGSIVGGLTALINGLIGSGLFTAAQGDAVTGVLAAVVTLLAAFGIVITTEKKVTPLIDPRDTHGRALTPNPSPRAGAHE